MGYVFLCCMQVVEMTEHHTPNDQRRNALFLSWSDFVLDSRLTFYEEVLHAALPDALVHNHVRFHDTEYIEDEFLSMYKCDAQPTRYLKQCCTLHRDTTTAVSAVLRHTSFAQLHRTPPRDARDAHPLYTAPAQSCYYDLHAFETDQRVLQRRYVLNHHTIDFITMLQASKWHDAFLDQLDRWDESIVGQRRLLCKHTRRAKSAHGATERPLDATLQQLHHELHRYRTVLQAFQDKGCVMQLLYLIRKQLRAQNKAIQFFLHQDHLHSLRTHHHTQPHLHDTRESYLALCDLYKKTLPKGKTRDAMRDIMIAQRRLMGVTDAKATLPTPFRQHLLATTPLTAYTETAPTTLWLLDNAFTRAAKKHPSLHCTCPSFAGALVSYTTNAFHTPVYKRLRTVYIEGNVIASQCYFDVYHTNYNTPTPTLVTTPTIVQPAGKHVKTVRSRARRVVFEEVGMMDGFYRWYVPYVRMTDGQQTDGAGIREHLGQRESFCLHPVELYRVYYV